MVMKDKIKGFVRPVVRAMYRPLSNEGENTPEGADFVDTFFAGRAEFEKLSSEINDAGVWEIVDAALGRYDEITAKGLFGSVDSELATACYALVRKMKPSTVVETGVCNGVSTLFILKAMDENKDGALYSVDYPYHADKSLEEFRSQTFDEYGGAAIPRDKQPGWIIPDGLRERWDLRLGKSQRQLPRLLGEVGNVDLFIHDSEHSHPCMMFEYELAWHQMNGEGVILSDDIGWNEAFQVFCDSRSPVWGTLTPNVGFMQKY
jgi:hypothetical protein